MIWFQSLCFCRIWSVKSNNEAFPTTMFFPLSCIFRSNLEHFTGRLRPKRKMFVRTTPTWWITRTVREDTQAASGMLMALATGWRRNRSNTVDGNQPAGSYKGWRGGREGGGYAPLWGHFFHCQGQSSDVRCQNVSHRNLDVSEQMTNERNMQDDYETEPTCVATVIFEVKNQRDWLWSLG